MNHKKQVTHRLLAFFICLSLVLCCMPVYAAEDDVMDLQNAEQVLDIVDAEETFLEEPAPDVDENAAEDPEEFSAADTVEADRLAAESPVSVEEDEQEEVVGAVSAPTKLWVEPSEDNGLPLRVDVFRKKIGSSSWGSTYAYQIYLPGNADPEKCYISWDGGATATTNEGGPYESGTCPVPVVGAEVNYSFKNENNRVLTELKIVVYQGSPDVTPVFIKIDESQGTIEQMKADKNNTCTGIIYIDGQQYGLEKMKGRGNATWKEAKDKKPYNINLDTKINFPGVDSEKTKKWTLLAEVLDRSLMCNRTGFHLAYELGIGQDTTSADVWMNGEYQGCYTVTPKTDSFVNKNGYMIEQDNYHEPAVADGGDPQFELNGLISTVSGWSSAYNCITVKKIGSGLLGKNELGETDESPERMEAVAAEIQTWLQEAWDAIRSDDGFNHETGKYYTEYIDIESFAKMYLMHEYVKSYDVCAGSIYFHRDGKTDADKLIAGPLWDLDNAMGSTYNNDMLGSQAQDRRSGAGDFIPVITEYKTSIYKTISKHADFMEEVKRQYNKYQSAFNSMVADTERMIGEISSSAIMNHTKVEELGHETGKDNHYYRQSTTLGTDQYRQVYQKTEAWYHYAQNLNTYIRTRSLWFFDKFYDENYICEHEYEPHVTEATCTADGIVHYVCKFCGDISDETETIPRIPHNYEDGYCTECGEKLITVTIDCDEGASVTVYETKDLTGPCEENATVAHPRDGDTGLIDCAVVNGEGSGQVNFVVNLKPGYELVSDIPVSAEPSTSFKNLKDQGNNAYRMTKVNDDVTIHVRTAEIVPAFKSHNLVLSGRIGVNFFVDLSMLTEEEREAVTMEFTLNGKTTTDTFDPNDTNPSTHTYYGFTCYVNSVQMADEITAELHYGEDKPVVSQTYSVKQYIDQVQNNSDGFSANAVALINSIADYGHYMQPFLAENNNWTIGVQHEIMPGCNTYSESDVSDALEAVEDKALAIELGDSQIEKVFYSLALDSETTIIINLKVKSGYTGAVTAKVDGKKVACRKQKDGRYQIRISGIPAHKLGDFYDIRVSAESECMIKVSPMSYVLSMLTTTNEAFNNEITHYAMTSLYCYYKAAMTYRADPNG